MSDTTQCLSFSVWLVSRHSTLQVGCRLAVTGGISSEALGSHDALGVPPCDTGSRGRVWGSVKDSESGLHVQPWTQRTTW